MKKRYVIRLSAGERRDLERLVSVGSGAAAKLTHARILLQADESAGGCGWTDAQIAEGLGVTTRMILNVRRRLVEQGLEAALVRKKACRPPRERILDGRQEAKLTALCCSQAPAGRERWSLRLLADQLVELKIVDSISHETVRRTLQKTR